MRRTRPLALITALTALLGLAAPATAAEVKGTGTVTYTVTVVAENNLVNGQKLRQSRMKGLILADQDNMPFNLSPQDCTNAAIIDDKGTMIEAHGTCVAVDVDGDVWWLSYEGDTDGSQWTITGGTGKYAGMTGGGTTDNLLITADGRFAIAWQGTLQMK